MAITVNVPLVLQSLPALLTSLVVALSRIEVVYAIKLTPTVQIIF